MVKFDLRSKSNKSEHCSVILLHDSLLHEPNNAYTDAVTSHVHWLYNWTDQIMLP